MTLEFNCITTGIGSMPHIDPNEAVKSSLEYLPHAPIWPQLPKRSFRERMDIQYSESLPGVVIDEKRQRIFLDTSRDLTPELEKFFEHYLAKDYSYFRISEDFAAGFYALLRTLDKAAKMPLFLKGHITGPLTMGTALKDESGKDIVHNELMFDATVKCLAMKAAWQIEALRRFGRPVIIFIDEPAMESLGSAFSAVSPDAVEERLNEIIDTIHELGGIAGIHCCGNADWPLIMRTRIDIVNFDAFGYIDKVLLYPDEIKAFINRGGTLAWGIVPTGAFTGRETAAELADRLRQAVLRLERYGINKPTLLKQCILTPSCGMGGLDEETTYKILRLLGDVANEIRPR